jgi:hypothetical protein
MQEVCFMFFTTYGSALQWLVYVLAVHFTCAAFVLSLFANNKVGLTKRSLTSVAGMTSYVKAAPMFKAAAGQDLTTTNVPSHHAVTGKRLMWLPAGMLALPAGTGWWLY